jgi:murein DD-endopeptidase MepM/ murein hydrolase activator NlpD
MGSSTDVDQGASLSVRFDRSMEREATAAAFSATIEGEPVTGSLRWAEDDTVLVLEPDQPLPHGARVILRVEVDARATDGQPLVERRAISFTVEPRPTPTPAPTPRPAPVSRDTGGSSSGAGRATGSTAGWDWPLDGPITQDFGQSLTIYGTHRGLDIDGDTGDPIRAAASGTVVVAGYYDACGGLDVHIDHGDGLVTWYRHLSRVLVSVGQRVDRGDLIGRVGSAGCSTGSHLHFAVRRGSTWLDPLDFLPRR